MYLFFLHKSLINELASQILFFIVYITCTIVCYVEHKFLDKQTSIEIVYQFVMCTSYFILVK